ncbi:hypothetical protein [Nocardioides flavescens]|uniref:Uncharacterized protein n=1 Tax=Nocardioides flavescens TaxID=2691959 RepID=A0A6L7EVA7_9ACTN|nr:hypothetical protein [Nocardioides flavescens]MXG88135.1 hypothetical protein [Nocardioides flavescens]
MRAPTHLRGPLAAAATVLGVLLASLAAAPAPAQAAVGGTTSAPGVVLYDACQQVPISYAIDPGGATSWRLQLQIFDPDGRTSQGFVANSNAGAATTGTFSMQFCGSELPGTWTVKGALCASFTCLFTDPQTGTAALADSTFEVRPAQSSAVLSAKRIRGGRYVLKARVSEERAQGWTPYAGALVRFERLVGDQWAPVVRRDLTAAGGVAKLRKRLPIGTRVRAVVQPADNTYGSVSGVLRLRR